MQAWSGSRRDIQRERTYSRGWDSSPGPGYGIVRQKRVPLIVASVDVAQCYDRIAHAFAALTLRANKAPESSVHCILQPIHNMEFYICTAHGESDNYARGVGNA